MDRERGDPEKHPDHGMSRDGAINFGDLMGKLDVLGGPALALPFAAPHPGVLIGVGLPGSRAASPGADSGGGKLTGGTGWRPTGCSPRDAAWALDLEAVACPADRLDRRLPKFAAQVAHVHIDEVRPGIEAHAPGHRQQLLP